MANLNAGMMCIKYVLFSANFIFVLMGVLVIAIGTALLTIYNDFESFLESHHFKPAEILIAVGVIIFFVSFIGCIGAIKESTMLVNVYALLLFLLLLLEISAGIAAFVGRCTILDDIKDNMEDALKDYTKSDSAKHAWDFTQKHMHCCGVEYPHDWAPEHVDGHLVIFGGKKFTVPYSCCINTPSFCYGIHKEGCSKALEVYVSNSSAAMGYVALGISIIQLLGVFIAVILAKSIRRVKTEQEMERQLNAQRFFEQSTAGEVQRDPRSTLFLPNSSSTDA